jgi:hypothetical protein
MSIEVADKAVLRLALGLGLAVLCAYGLALPLPWAVCVMAVLLLFKPGPPVPVLKGLLMGAVIAMVVGAGVLMVPVLEHYALAGVALTGALLYAVFRAGAGGGGGAQTTIMAIALAIVPVAGVAEQALALRLGTTLALGIAIGALAGSVSHILFPDAPVRAPARPPATAPAPAPAGQDQAGQIALQATLVVMPVFVLALANPSFYLAAVMKAVLLGQQAGASRARTAGRALVGSTLMGTWMAALIWLGLSLLPNLPMLMLWLMAAALWAGARLFGVKPSPWPPSFWSNALVTMLILLGAAIEDSVNGEDVLRASAVRVTLFVLVALYAWGMVWVLERWRAAQLVH